MRILFLAPHPFFQHRGTPLAERAFLEVVTSEGHEVEVVTFGEGEHLNLPHCRIVRTPDRQIFRGIRPGFSFRKLAADGPLLWKSLQRTRAWRPDLVHAVEESAFLALVLKIVFGVPYVYDMDSSMPEQLTDKYGWLVPIRPVMQWAEALVIRHSTAVLAVCPALADLARAAAPDVLTACIEDATMLDETLEAPAPRSSDSVPVVMYVGSLESYQGIGLLLQSMAWVVRQGVRARLVIVGGSPSDIERYARESDTLGIATSVEFAGRRPVSELASWLRKADVLVSPRLGGRNTPMKIYSYLDSMRPIVATRVLTHTQVLDDAVAMLAEPTPEALGTAIKLLVDDPRRGRVLAEQARALVRERYTPARAADKIRALYRQLDLAASQRGAS